MNHPVYCARCHGPATLSITATGPNEHRGATSCPRHERQVAAWCAKAGGPVHTKTIAQPDQLTLFPDGAT